MPDQDLEQLKQNHEELKKTVVAIGEAAEARDKHNESEIIEMKERIAADDKRRRPWGFGEMATAEGPETDGEFARFDARDKLHPMQRALEHKGAIRRTAMGRDTQRDELILEFHAACDEFNVLRAYYESKNRGHKVNSVELLREFAPQTVRKIAHYADLLGLGQRTTGGGMDTITELAAWLPTGWSQSMIELSRTASVLGNIFPSIQMPTPVYNSPLEGGDLQAYLCAQTTGDITAGDTDVVYPLGSKSTTAQMVLTAKKFGVRNVISDEAVEDSILPVVPYLNRKHALAHALALDEWITDGQTTQIDTGIAGGTMTATDTRKAGDGLRRMAISIKTAATLDMGTFTTDKCGQLRGKMGPFGTNIQDLLFIVSYSGLYNMTVTGNMQTVDKYGALASIITGYPGGPAGPNEVGRMFGIPIVLVGNTIWELMNASGIYDGSTMTKSCMLLVNKSAFWHGVRSPLNVKILNEVYAPWGAVGLISYSRHAFADAEAGATKLDVVYGYNVGKA